ncbi:MAG: BON domain-containing protein [Gammaproteobacteria bacterium]|nr:BON domain-containing protein [Gammaproteobacteria bacterium]
MNQLKYVSTFFLVILLAPMLGCTSTAKHEGAGEHTVKHESTGEYIDDTIITTKVKAAIFNEPSLKSAEINVETFKGVVQLSGFVHDKADINKAVEVARHVKGVKSVKNDLLHKH